MYVYHVQTTITQTQGILLHCATTEKSRNKEQLKVNFILARCMLWRGVCPSVCLSDCPFVTAGVLSKQLKYIFTQPTPHRDSSFLMRNILTKIQWDHP